MHKKIVSASIKTLQIKFDDLTKLTKIFVITKKKKRFLDEKRQCKRFRLNFSENTGIITIFIESVLSEICEEKENILQNIL